MCWIKHGLKKKEKCLEHLSNCEKNNEKKETHENQNPDKRKWFSNLDRTRIQPI